MNTYQKAGSRHLFGVKNFFQLQPLFYKKWSLDEKCPQGPEADLHNKHCLQPKTNRDKKGSLKRQLNLQACIQEILL